jgi:hypothetical protein
MLTIWGWPAPHPINKAAAANPRGKGKDISFIEYLRDVGFLVYVANQSTSANATFSVIGNSYLQRKLWK